MHYPTSPSYYQLSAAQNPTQAGDLVLLYLTRSAQAYIINKMFKGNDDSSEEQNQLDTTPIIQKLLIVDPLISVQHLICSICFHVVWDPVVCGSPTGCYNAFCATCINSWLGKSNVTCPTCKKNFRSQPVPPILRSVLDGLVLKCPNNLGGCAQRLKYADLGHHVRSCDYKIQRCRGCRKGIIQRDYLEHVSSCDQFIIECPKCGIKLVKALMATHTRTQCFEKQIAQVGSRVANIEHDIEQICNSMTKLEQLTGCFLSGQPLQMNIQLYTTFNQHFVFPNPTLIKPSFNQEKQKYDFLHFYVLNPIYTGSIVSIKWAIKINKLVGNLLLGFCSSLGVNSLDYVINKYGIIKRKGYRESKYKLVRKADNGFMFGCGDVVRFRYASLAKCIKIYNETRRVGLMLQTHEIEEIGEKVYTFYSMDTLNDSISFI